MPLGTDHSTLMGVDYGHTIKIITFNKKNKHDYYF